MPELKYSHLFVTRPLTETEWVSRGYTVQKREEGIPFPNVMVYADSQVAKDCPTTAVTMFEPGSKRLDSWVKAHTHDYDEIIGFVSTSAEDPYNLGGEVEMWVEEEKYTLTKSFTVFVPKGLKHCPISLKVERPIVHFSILPGAPAYQLKRS